MIDSTCKQDSKIVQLEINEDGSASFLSDPKWSTEPPYRPDHTAEEVLTMLISDELKSDLACEKVKISRVILVLERNETDGEYETETQQMAVRGAPMSGTTACNGYPLGNGIFICVP